MPTPEILVRLIPAVAECSSDCNINKLGSRFVTELFTAFIKEMRIIKSAEVTEGIKRHFKVHRGGSCQSGLSLSYNPQSRSVFSRILMPNVETTSVRVSVHLISIWLQRAARPRCFNMPRVFTCVLCECLPLNAPTVPISWETTLLFWLPSLRTLLSILHQQPNPPSPHSHQPAPLTTITLRFRLHTVVPFYSSSSVSASFNLTSLTSRLNLWT